MTGSVTNIKEIILYNKFWDFTYQILRTEFTDRIFFLMSNLKEKQIPEAFHQHEIAEKAKRVKYESFNIANWIANVKLNVINWKLNKQELE